MFNFIIVPSLDVVTDEDRTAYKLQGIQIFVGTQEEFMLAAKKLFNLKSYSIVQHKGSALDNQDGN